MPCTVSETQNRIRGELTADLLTDTGRDPAGLAAARSGPRTSRTCT
ncbi:hypothetical protein [Streptomyces sp. A0958]|nr:hypothetical protein [Streptomyces sp. A0958]